MKAVSAFHLLTKLQATWRCTDLVHLRKKCQTTIAELSDEKAHQLEGWRDAVKGIIGVK